ncbi:hypothetical protein C7387_0722 [Yokenella regensburgei]|uniref:SGNH/GDSL hydrolase family protein n=1 Tax=Yokenella regensburgei TaxID=158877 RepID=A0ABX9S069_9ENTR|nr:hypothetical protein [Yokenella regensburgei]RKR64044.1 hypothetical protein C7387_0722 [Yokenella regensburgei]VFS25744.1 Uncharacterised protein [Yokenella regensburgei]
MRYKTGFAIFISIIILAVLGYGYAFINQYNKGIPAEWWLVNTVDYKNLVAEKHSGKRIMVVSGSNSLFSVNSNVIKEKTGIQTINMAMHAGLDIDFYKYIIKKYTHKGDVVVIPLEYEFYTRQNAYNDWFVNNMASWGGSYLKSLPPTSAVKLLTYLSPKRIYEGITTVEPVKFEDKSIVSQFYEHNDGIFYGYNFRSMNATGDINANPKISAQQEAAKEAPRQCLGNNLVVSDYTIRELKEIKSIVEKSGATMILTYPVYMKNAQCSMDNKETSASLKVLADTLSKNDISIKCSPGMSMLDPVFFMDPPYHANAIGAEIRSTFLGECLKEIITTGDDKNSRKIPVEVLRKMEAELSSKVAH